MTPFMALEPSLGVPEPGRLFCPHGSSKLQTSVTRSIKALQPCMGSPF